MSSLNFEHQDWIGTERLLTGSDGSAIGSYTSYPFGDGFTDNGTDLDPYHFAGMDHDYESTLDHATFREYANAGGRWVSPDPYGGSYDWSDPQSFNRYTYALNNPLSLSDPSGQFAFCGVTAGEDGGLAVAGPAGWAALGFCAGEGIFKLLGLFSHTQFHGSLKPRPNAQPWDEYNIMYGPNIAGALGLPDETCEFGACGDGGMSFTNGLTVAVPFCTQHPTICTLGEDAASLLREIPVVAAASITTSMEGDNEPGCMPQAGTQCYEEQSGHTHNNWDPHSHIWTMNQNPSTHQCHWNRGAGTRGTTQFPPAGMEPCSAYPTWVSR